MTTKVTVDAHAGWPVDVTTIDTYEGKVTRSTERVAAKKVREFYLTSNRELLFAEVQPEQQARPQPADRMLQFFAYEHLPAHLQAVSRPFGELAREIVATLPSNAERTAGLRKLLEAKDCAVRALLYKD
jgi:hypothetical protein